MNIQDVIGELLYIGIVAEKGSWYAFDNMSTDMKKKYQHLLERKEINEH